MTNALIYRLSTKRRIAECHLSVAGVLRVAKKLAAEYQTSLLVDINDIGESYRVTKTGRVYACSR